MQVYRVRPWLPGAIATIAVMLACADGIAPDRSPDVLAGVGGPTAKDSAPGVGSDTTVPPGRLRGMVVATSPDSTTAWQPVGSVRLEAAQRDARTGDMTILATTTSNAAGRFVFDDLSLPAGLVYLRAVPSGATAYRASRWLAGYAFVGSWVTIGEGGPGAPPANSWTLGPYLVLERADAPASAYAPTLVVGYAAAVDDAKPIADAMLIIDRAIVVGSDTVSAGVAASGRTDANGFALVSLPGPGLYLQRLTMAPGSSYRDPDGTTVFTAAANTDATRLIVSRFALPRR